MRISDWSSDVCSSDLREVIVQHEAFVTQAGQAVDHLLGFLGAEGAGRDRLRLAAGEKRRTVRARQEVRFGLDRAELRRRAAVDASAVLQRSEAGRVGTECVGRFRLRWEREQKK